MKKGFWWNDGYADALSLGIKCVGEWDGISGADSDGIHCYRFWILDFNYENFGEFLCGPDNRWISRTPGWVQLVRANTCYEVRKANSVNSHAAYIGFRNGETAGLDRLTGDSNRAVFRDPGFLLGGCLSKGADIAEELGENSYWIVLGTLCEMIGLLLAATPLTDGTFLVSDLRQNNQDRNQLEYKLQKFLADNLERRLSLKEMAEGLGVSVSTLTHYPLANGESPQARHLKMRLEHACELLFTGTPLKEISERLGFADISHFSRAFKAQYDISPAKFKMQGRSTFAKFLP